MGKVIFLNIDCCGEVIKGNIAPGIVKIGDVVLKREKVVSYMLLEHYLFQIVVVGRDVDVSHVTSTQITLLISCNCARQKKADLSLRNVSMLVFKRDGGGNILLV